jgi:TonB-linked SusC/RagA family outer membrane protein
MIAEKKVTVHVANATLKEALEACFRDQKLTYNVVGKSVVISAANKGNVDYSVQQSENNPPLIDVHGRVVNEKGEPVANVTVAVKGKSQSTTTDANGEFSLATVDRDAVLVFTHVSMETFELKVSGKTDLAITLKTKVAALGDVVVTVNTGYQEIPKERATGSFDYLDNKLINRSISTNILDRLDGVASGLIFNKNITTQNVSNQSNITIRGRSTIFANPNPLIIVDNFPYYGDLSTINPNDIESITVLKDAAAASIWGAYSGNGVIVLTTKSGKYNQPVEIDFNTYVNIKKKPDLYYSPQLNSSDFIDVENYLFNQGYYSSTVSTPYGLATPVVDILNKQMNGIISASEADAEINALRSNDSRSDLRKYFYQNAVEQQYAVNLHGGGANFKYFFSLGYNSDKGQLVRNLNNRLTIKSSNVYSCFDKKLEFTTNLTFSQENTFNNGMQDLGVKYPYALAIDNNGNRLALPTNFRESYTDTAGQGLLLDWKYRPLDELSLNDNTNKLIDYRVNLGMNYKIIPGFDLKLLGQYERGINELSNFYHPNSYYARNLINTYSQIDGSSGSVIRKIPLGGILDNSNGNLSATTLRSQLNYVHDWQRMHSIAVLGGIEIGNIQNKMVSTRFYGYNDALETNIPVDYVTYFPLYYNNSATGLIENDNTLSSTTNHFISFFANMSYKFKDKYGLSASIRKDEANIFGVKTNQKGVPLWSVGGSWDISKEAFYQLNWLPYLKLRLTDGYNGNVDPKVSALVTASSGVNNKYGLPTLSLNNAPNNKLRWERVNIVNLGIDFQLIQKAIEGSLEFYLKNGSDLIGMAPIDPTTGIVLFKGNTASIKGRGIDLNLQSNNINRTFKWTTNFLFSYTKDKVTRYLVQPSSVSDFLSNAINPIIGNPLYSLYAFKWAGLSPTKGDPQILLNGNKSFDYATILGSSDITNLEYIGTTTPTIFGSLRNTFSYKHLSLSFNITYKFHYYFRKSSVSYNNLFSGNPFSNNDYVNRWKAPGDEQITNIPSMVYPADYTRDNIYSNSDILVDKGDHIRLKDIQFSYDVLEKRARSLPIKALNLYLYANNLGIIWRANKDKIDPDYIPNYTGYIYPDPRSIAIGLKATF